MTAETSDTPRVSVIVLSWNRRDDLRDCLAALAAQTYDAREVVVVDNGSIDGSAEMVRADYPDVRLIRSESNLGFAAGNNLAIRSTDAPYVVTLNNDAVAEAGWLAALVATAETDPTLGSVASKMVFQHDPSTINSCGIALDRAGIAWDLWGGYPAAIVDRPREVFGPCAGAALYRRAMLDDVGLFDEDFFAYLEDVDLSWRARLRGWRCVLAPNAVVRHAHSGTLGEGSPLKRYLLARNKVWTVAKCAPGAGLWRNLPVAALYDAGAVAFAVARHRDWASLRGRLAGLAGLPRALRKRAEIQRRRAVAPRSLEALYAPLAAPWDVPRRYRHLLGDGGQGTGDGGQGDTGTRGRGDTETRGHGDTQTRRPADVNDDRIVTASPRRPIAASAHAAASPRVLIRRLVLRALGAILRSPRSAEKRALSGGVAPRPPTAKRQALVGHFSWISPLRRFRRSGSRSGRAGACPPPRGPALNSTDGRGQSPPLPDEEAMPTGTAPLVRPPTPDPRPARSLRVVVLRPDHLGDVLLSRPAIEALLALEGEARRPVAASPRPRVEPTESLDPRAKTTKSPRPRVTTSQPPRPQVDVTVIAGPWGTASLQGLPVRVVAFPFPGFTRQAKGGPLAPYAALLAFAARLRRERYDAVLMLRPDHWWGALAAAMAGIPIRLGHATPETSPFLTHRVSPDPTEHATQASLRAVKALAAALDLEPLPEADATVRFDPTSEADQVADAWIASYVEGGRPIVMVHPGAGASVKTWPSRRWARIGDALRSEAAVVLTGGSADAELIAGIQALSAEPLAAATDLTWDQLAALYRRADVVVGMDSGPLHLAAAVGTPTVRVYGPSDPRVYGPAPSAEFSEPEAGESSARRQSQDWLPPWQRLPAALAAALPCVPCGNLVAPPCGYLQDPPCLASVDPAAVVAAVRAALRVPTQA